MWNLIKLIGGFITAYKKWVWIAAIGTVAITGLTYVHNYGQMKAEIVSLERQIKQAEVYKDSCQKTVTARNKTIAEINLIREKDLAEANAKLAAVNKTARLLRIERDRVTAELSVARFELLEAIRDDEEFANWVDYTVPIAGWSLLQQAREGHDTN